MTKKNFKLLVMVLVINDNTDTGANIFYTTLVALSYLFVSLLETAVSYMPSMPFSVSTQEIQRCVQYFCGTCNFQGDIV